MVPRKWNDDEMDVKHHLTMPLAAGKNARPLTSSISFAAYFTTKITTCFFAFVLQVLFDWRHQRADSTFEVFHASTLQLFQSQFSVLCFQIFAALWEVFERPRENQVQRNWAELCGQWCCREPDRSRRCQTTVSCRSCKVWSVAHLNSRKKRKKIIN